MKSPRFVLITLALMSLINAAITQDKALPPGVTRVPAEITGGRETEGQDRGRPVALIAAALGVKPEVFRDTFSGVRPAGPGSGGPTHEEAQRNKRVLLDKLSKHGITNERLDEVSNFYRYPPGSRELWRHREAKVNALVKGDAVIGYEIADAGAGYTNAPKVLVPGVRSAAPKVALRFGKDLQTNGSLQAVR